ncbi:GNAT family N-acetyltransferase [Streptomyces sp. NPDC046557]|uniref:GNAT family N-acetyltransferase n=1 Tax=Streptomyces sp. NPDC046557 TaxID=3155372 RepID=UPI0034028316
MTGVPVAPPSHDRANGDASRPPGCAYASSLCTCTSPPHTPTTPRRRWHLALSHTVPSPGRPGLAEIRTFFAHPDAWGTGITAAVMTATLDRLHDDGYDGAHLRTLRDTPRSRRFYTKSGFTESGATRTHDFGDGTPLAQVEYVRPR